ncbi:SDR family oxidoreductase [Enterovirga sp. CN4-39]|uniref:SDR family oxidoreductase n=1 Tax=Enterovirga sp. CN4-39 TaxID=3400910 RepID=UPI003BFF3338
MTPAGSLAGPGPADRSAIKSALVTGAVRRIGLAIAEGLAAAGYDVALHCSPASRHEAEAAASRIGAGGRRAVVVPADLADPASPNAILDTANAALGPLTLLVNSAALFEPDSADSPDPRLLDRHFAVNLRAPVLLASAFAAQVPDGTEASVVNIIDQRVLRPNPAYFSYTLAKSALWTATQTMAQAYAARRIRVNAIGPGPTAPNPFDGEEGMRAEAAGTPLARPIAPAEIAEAVLFLAQARNVTGQLICVDAGQHLGWKTPDFLGAQLGHHTV